MYSGMMLTLCSTKVTNEYLLSANLTTREYVFVLPNAKKRGDFLELFVGSFTFKFSKNDAVCFSRTFIAGTL